ncbi:MAG TPA: kelch repeat-containing protein [Acidimicrobiales bacterium]
MPTTWQVRLRTLVLLLAVAVLPTALSVLVGSAPAKADAPALPGSETKAASTIPGGDPRVYFLGDSVTAGFGYCGKEGGTDSSDITCGVDQPFNNDWTGTNSLQACAPPPTLNDRCSNNNDAGMPWDAGPWVNEPGAPTVAYSYAIARKQSTVDPAAIENWAVTGSTPTDWDPVTNGRFGAQLKKIKNATVVMTLGANPLLSDYLDISALGLVTIEKGSCASSAVVARRTVEPGIFDYRAAELGTGPDGVLNCFDAEWQRIEQTKHLVDIYESLLNDGDHVLVLGYPMGCPWSFGNWQPNANLLSGPAEGNACTSQSHFGVSGSAQVTQWDQAVALTTHANQLIKAALDQAGEATQHSGDIAFASPSGNWADHQAWSSDPWIFKNDTWVHPNAAGHEQLAQTVITEMCARFKNWCGNPPHWDPSPAPRDGAAMAYDPATKQLVFFGGHGTDAARGRNDTWIWNGGTWKQLATATAPPARYRASMAFDPATNQLILFGGFDDTTSFDDTWAWDGATWKKLAPASSPSPRFGTSIAYDPGTKQLILFGGNTAGGSYLNDTWTWDGETWKQLAPASSPSPRYGASMDYYPATNQLVLFGGFVPGPGSLNDTWTWDGATWRVLPPPSVLAAPSPRYLASMAYDPATNQLVLFGGYGDVNDTWTWGEGGWQKLAPATSPSARSGASIAYDPVFNQLVLFGGADSSNDAFFNDTWTWNGATWTTLGG